MAVSNVQQGLLALEQGKLGIYLRIVALITLVIALVLLNLFFHFRGLADASVMNQAQIARNISQGKSFTTNVITPRALTTLKANNPALMGSSEAVDVTQIPDIIESPLLPYVYSVPMHLVSNWNFDDLQEKMIFPADRLLAGVSMLFLLGAVIVWFFVAKILFDTRIALLAVSGVLLTDILWLMSLQSLPQAALLLFFGLAILATLRAELEQERGNFVLTLLYLCLAAVGFALMMLTHGAAAFIFAGWLIFIGIFFVPRGVLAIVPLIIGVLVVMPWLMRNYLVCGNPFGISLGGVLGSSNLYGDYLRFESGGSGFNIRNAVTSGITNQLGSLLSYLGINIVAMTFFLTLLHKFRNPTTAMLRWGLLIMWIAAALGMCIFRPTGAVSLNQFHVLFLPAFIAYGFAFLIVLWGRWNISGEIFTRIFLTMVLIVCASPMVLRLTTRSPMKIQWPPYFPHMIAMVGDWYEKDEIIASDIPCGVAWYTQRTSLLIPSSFKTFVDMHDYRAFQQPIKALYLTPASMDQRLYTDIYGGKFPDWAPLIVRFTDGRNPATRPLQISGLPLPVWAPLPINGQSIIFTDRPRWAEPRPSKSE